MKRTRQLHLWIGLICSVFILIQSITGLLLSEKWLTGSGGAEMRPPGAMTQGMTNGNSTGAAPSNQSSNSMTPSTAGDQGTSGATQRDRPAFNGPGPGPGQDGANSLTGFIKGLHEEKIGNTNVKWLVDIAAISMIFLTITGIILSIKTLRAQGISRKKRRTLEA
ncbi:PepSY-associated TM helix domain-containing protein [Paenibacillus andongensis]|uniref:PepSY-associated TM helix domain-containing protein n=1 Tax=Paenibacillus andongensis TaxID=2975482 RepID=UPI0021BBB544|nr:PepSY-associated TM helix domain-containing protein [Paenibacillus andongensis]